MDKLLYKRIIKLKSILNELENNLVIAAFGNIEEEGKEGEIEVRRLFPTTTTGFVSKEVMQSVFTEKNIPLATFEKMFAAMLLADESESEGGGGGGGSGGSGSGGGEQKNSYQEDDEDQEVSLSQFVALMKRLKIKKTEENKNKVLHNERVQSTSSESS